MNKHRWGGSTDEETDNNMFVILKGFEMKLQVVNSKQKDFTNFFREILQNAMKFHFLLNIFLSVCLFQRNLLRNC